MNAGLPTTGVGGIFYLLSILVMFIVEITRSLFGKSSLKSWITVCEQLLLFTFTIIAIWLTGELLIRTLPTQVAPFMVAVSNDSIFLFPFLLLLFLISSTQILRGYFYIKNNIHRIVKPLNL